MLSILHGLSYIQKIVIASFVLLLSVAATGYYAEGSFFEQPLIIPFYYPPISFLNGMIWLFCTFFMGRSLRFSMLLCPVAGTAVSFMGGQVFGLAYFVNNPLFPCAFSSFLAVLIVYVQKATIETKKLELLAELVLVFLLFNSVAVFLRLSMNASPVYDFHILAFEKTAGLLFMRDVVALIDHPLIVRIIRPIYLGVILLISALMVEETMRGMKGRFALVYLLATIVGFFIYFFVPAVGPGVALDHYKLYPTNIVPSLLWPMNDVFSPRNAMLSLHTTWALLIIYRSLMLPRLSRLIYIVLALVNILATLALHEHWVTDLFVAVPFSVLILALSRQIGFARTKKLVALEAMCFLLVVSWLALLRWSPMLFEHHHHLAQTFIVLTVILPVVGLRVVCREVSQARI